MSDEKSSEAIMVRVTPTQMVRVASVAAKSGIKPATMAKMGLLEVIDRLEAQAPGVDPLTAAMIANARARGIDVGAVLTAALTASYAADPVTQRTGTEG